MHLRLISQAPICGREHTTWQSCRQLPGGKRLGDQFTRTPYAGEPLAIAIVNAIANQLLHLHTNILRFQETRIITLSTVVRFCSVSSVRALQTRHINVRAGQGFFWGDNTLLSRSCRLVLFYLKLLVTSFNSGSVEG